MRQNVTQFVNRFKVYYETRLKSTQKQMNEFWTEIVIQFNKQLTHLWLQSMTKAFVSFGYLLGHNSVFDSSGLKTNDCINKLREFISNQFNNNCNIW